ncbi:MAG: transcription initiation factor IIB, partial [Promethearchaeia archaeon]
TIITQPHDYVSRFGTDLRLPGKTQMKAIDILNAAKKIHLTVGKDPKGMAAAALYVAGILTQSRRTQLEIAETARVTEVTVRNRYKEMVEKLKISALGTN